MLERYLLMWLVLLCGVAYAWPAGSACDPFLAAPASSPGKVVPRIPLPWLIGITMFAVGCMLPRDEVREVARRWRTVVAGTALQYTAMPALAFAVSRLVPLDATAVIGIAMVGCVPGAMASNVLTLMGRGNVSYSVSLTTMATLLSPIAVPAALFLTLHTTVRLDLAAVARQLVLMVVGPVVLGFLICRKSERLRRMMLAIGPIVANATILWIIAVVVAANRQKLAAAGGVLILALIVMNLLGYAAGFAGGYAFRLTRAMRRALVLEIGMQNAGLGTTLVVQFFPEQPSAAIPTALYTFGCMFTGTMLAHWWARRDERRAGDSAGPCAQPGPLDQ